MQHGEPIFEIAVYRKSPRALENEYDEDLVKLIHSLDPHYPLSKISQDPALNCIQHQFWKKRGEPYPYNQVIGWMLLVAKRHQILIEYYKSSAKRLTRNCRRHRIKYEGYI